MTSKTDSPPPFRSKRRLYTAITLAICLLLGLVYLTYWLGWGRFKVKTNDAYVNGNMIMLTPQVRGIVTTLLADNAELVEEGQPIVKLDPHEYEISLEHARGALSEMVRQVTQLFIKVDELKSSVNARKADLLRALQDYGHRRALVNEGGVSREDFEHSQTTLMSAFATLKETEQMLRGAFAEIENTTVPTHPKVVQAAAEFKNAYLKLRRCTVLSPVRGIVTQRKAMVGEFVAEEDNLLAIVPLDQIWVDANFREVQLKNLRIGQDVRLTSDMYGADVVFHGKVYGLNPGTGSVFSVLPPQNATGNWIKIIQRVPVRISLDPDEIKKKPLVLGLSMYVNVNIRNLEGLQLPSKINVKPLYKTTIYDNELAEVGQLITQIISDNSQNGIH